MGTISEEKLKELTNIVYEEQAYDDRYSDVSEPDYELLYDIELLKEGISEGIKQGMEEATDSLWHDYTELPDFKQPIVYASKLGYNHISSITIVTPDEFSAIERRYGEFKWCYSKDILPKEYFK